MTSRLVTLAAACVAPAWLLACSEDPAASCEPGTVIECACIDGTTGQQACAADGTFLPCDCSGGGGGLDAGVVDGGTPDAGGCRLAEDEWCDGRDNDCDGRIDNDEACVDSTVTNVEPYAGTAFVQENDSICSYARVRRVWPTLAATDRDNTSDCYAEWFAFRPTDGRGFYYASFSGIHRNRLDSPDPLVPTPPCDEAGPIFGFDGDGVLHYTCGYSLYRGNGVEVASDLSGYITTLADGRSIITRPALTDPEKRDFVAIGSDGAELSRLSPHADFVGTLTPNYSAAAPVGSRAYVTYRRWYGQRDYEIVVFRLTETSEWQRVRRAVVESIGWAQLALPDGTVLVEDSDPRGIGMTRVVAYHPDQTVDVLWSEIDDGESVHGRYQLLLGPP